MSAAASNEGPANGFDPGVERKRALESIGETIRLIAKRRHVTQTRLGALLGLSSGAMTQRLNGVTPIKVDELLLIAHALNVPPEALLRDPAEVIDLGEKGTPPGNRTQNLQIKSLSLIAGGDCQPRLPGRWPRAQHTLRLHAG